jgi:murein DD-endopeptidase MepM/ murein hydrolase activator NlpD
MLWIKAAAAIGTLAVGGAAGALLQLNSASAAPSPDNHPAVAVASARPTATASAAACQAMPLAIAFTTNVRDATGLHLQLPWGRPGDAEGRMIEDYGAYNGTSIREHLPVHDVTTGALIEMSGHNAIDIILDSGTPLYAITSGTAYRLTNWTIPGGPQGWAVVVVSDVLRDDRGEPIAFLYGHVREFDVENGQPVVAGALIAKSGGDPDDPGAGFSDMANVHLEIIESPSPLTAHAGTVNPHQFLENLYGYAAASPGCVTD